MTPLQGKTLLVTGASSGIGQALCELLVERGANVLGDILMRSAEQQM